MVYKFDDNLKKLPSGEEFAIQMDDTLLMNIEGNRNFMKMEEVNPKHWGCNKESYRSFSINGSGYNKNTNCFHLEAKTWFYKLVIKVKTDNFFIKNALIHGDLLEINKNYNTGDEINLYMVKQIEFKANSSSDCDIIVYYVPPFVMFWDVKEEGDEAKKNYLIQYPIHTIGKYIHFYKGLYKFAMDDTLNKLLDDKKEVKNLYLKNYTNIFGEEQNKFYHVYNNGYIGWWDEEELKK